MEFLRMLENKPHHVGRTAIYLQQRLSEQTLLPISWEFWEPKSRQAGPAAIYLTR
jgi:hypothetical protein